MAIALTGRPTSGTWASFEQMLLDNDEVADAYESLYAALRLAAPLESVKSILVTSAEPGEGKTTVSSCLAITASLAGQTALLIDGDLRRSALAIAARSAHAPGFIEFLLGRADADAVIRSLPAGEELSRSRISFMAGGLTPPLALGGVDWSRARKEFSGIAQRFDVVFVDSPPILAANDALLFAGIVDAVVLVVGTGNARLDEIGRAKEQLAATGTPIIGVVLNRFEPKVHGPSDQPYRGYYRRQAE